MIDPATSPPESAARVVVSAAGVSKRFARFHRRATSLKERLVRREQGVKEDFWALRGVDLVVHEGETVGITGPNGSGKSTLLKVLSGILQPTDGQIHVSGRVASLLELGAGFDGELTGRENIYLNSALLGVPRSETDRLFDQIVDFSELRDFIDNPVKHYSSGMYIRLGFAVAVHVDPDLLIIDEVLAVGDAAFQQKCMERIRLFQRQGKTILFVSHASSQITSLCSRAVLLDHGSLVFDGPPEATVRRLHELLGIDLVERRDDGIARVTSARLVDPSTDAPQDTFRTDSEALFTATIEWLVREPLPEPPGLELEFLVGNETVAVVRPSPFRLSQGSPARGKTHLKWLIPALPTVTGEVSLRATLHCAGSQLAVAEIPSLHLLRGEIVAVEGLAAVVDTEDADTP